MWELDAMKESNSTEIAEYVDDECRIVSSYESNQELIHNIYIILFVMPAGKSYLKVTIVKTDFKRFR